MLTRIQALNYRCFKYIDQHLRNFNVLVGANGSGKSTFLDVVCLLQDILRDGRNGISSAIARRSANYVDLLFQKEGDFFDLALEARIPETLSKKLIWRGNFETARYQIRIGVDSSSNELAVLREQLILKRVSSVSTIAPNAQPATCTPLPVFEETDETCLAVVERKADYFDIYWAETPDDLDRIQENRFRLGPQRSAFANLPEDESRFPVSVWFRRLITDGSQLVDLDYDCLRMPSTPNLRSAVKLSDGSNLAWLVEELRSKHPASFDEWLAHVRVAIPDLLNVTTVERPEDRHRYMLLDYASDFTAPSWMVSEGTLRLLALTLTAYLLDDGRTLLVEEPENCIHPLAIEIVMQSLNTMYESQVIVTTHSPAILSLTSPENILCFSKSADSGTSIVRGDLHPRMSAWKGIVDPGMLLASGILG